MDIEQVLLEVLPENVIEFRDILSVSDACISLSIDTNNSLLKVHIKSGSSDSLEKIQLLYANLARARNIEELNVDYNVVENECDITYQY